jgi:hypothetical protein
MWDNDAPADTPLTRVAPATADRADTCATCKRPAAPGRLRRDTCVNAEFDTLRATFGEEWYNAHKQWQRGDSGHGQP